MTSAKRLLIFTPLFALSLLLSGATQAGAPNEARRYTSKGPSGPIALADAEINLNDRFNTADTDDSESISLEEFAAAAEARGVERSFADRRFKMMRRHQGRNGNGDSTGNGERRAAFEADLFNAMDLDGNGELSADEASAANRKAASRTLMVGKRFAKLDSNDDGQLDRTEFSAQLDWLRMADADANGEVTREEMRAHAKAARESRG